MSASYAIAVESSANAKTGRVSATYVSQESCPDTCSFKGSGCYAESGAAAFTTRRLNRASAANPGLDVETIARAEAEAIRSLTGKLPLRVHVVGDCTTPESAAIVGLAMREHEAKRGQFAWSYTHAWCDVPVESWQGASVLASCETGDDVRAAHAAGYATAIVVDEHPSNKLYEKDGARVLPCPQEANPDKVTCASCGLCSKAPMLLAKGLTIGFAAHSARADKVREALKVRASE